MKRTDTTPQTAATAETALSSEAHATVPQGSAQPTSHNQNAEPNTGLSPAVQKHIGNLLKVSYQNLLTEPVPDRFANLLEQLEQAEKKGK